MIQASILLSGSCREHIPGSSRPSEQKLSKNWARAQESRKIKRLTPIEEKTIMVLSTFSDKDAL